MIIYYFYFKRICFFPNETNTPFIVNANTILTFSITL